MSKSVTSGWPGAVNIDISICYGLLFVDIFKKISTFAANNSFGLPKQLSQVKNKFA